ncbi:DUF202 domain-containing protein [Marinactinospora rubrisoli]|uniref:DUF202 domain-containing protein n=1 Tax=Marinactinospora rubrisoli TaxID=2715399 RepID=A0ABW2K8I2_9ACTN
MTRRAATGRDPGLQPERTLLSWQRTVIVVLGVALLFLRDPFVSTATFAGEAVPPSHRLIAVLATTLPLAVIVVHVRRRWRRAHGGRADSGAAPAPLARFWAMVLLSASVVVLAAGVVVTAFRP